MKVFISHQNKDSEIASQIYSKLSTYNVDAYLDTFDDSLVTNSRALTEHLKKIVRRSSDILVVMSEHTKDSWWVPFEIGIAANQDLPTVTYLHSYVRLPEYLDYWPRLKSLNDIDKYVRARNERLQETINSQESYRNMFSAGESSTDNFYRRLKAAL